MACTLLPSQEKVIRAMNRWGIPRQIESIVRQRDGVCVYCGVELVDSIAKGQSRARLGTWEHIINDARIVTLENIARCCCSCNASKGSKDLSRWFGSDYCRSKGITIESVAPVVRNRLLKLG